MRKVNVFGKKINQINTIYIIVFVFAIIFGFRTWMISVQSDRLEELQQEELRLDRELNQLLEEEQNEWIYPIGDIITYLPTESSELDIIADLVYVKNSSGLGLIENYQYTIDMDADNPFEENLPNTMVFIRIELELTTTQLSQVYDLIDALTLLDRIYYIDSADVSLDVDLTTEITIYTFYNEISLD